MNDETSEIVIEIAKEFFQLVQSLDQDWSKAFYRFRQEGSRFGSNGSYVANSQVMLISALKNDAFYDIANAKGEKLLKALRKEKGMFLLTIDSEFKYDIQFEWDDISRWEITKLNGATGLPKGV